jgi:REP element-mobilizing transposase RayT
MFFVTGCCAQRGRNQLCAPDPGHALLASAQFYHDRHDWFLRLFLLMPDHFHALIGPAPDKRLSRLLGDWKRFTTTQHHIDWQKNFIDHRLRSNESWELKAAYIRLNPVRAGLIKEGEPWPYLIEN